MVRYKITEDELERRTTYGPTGGEKGQKLQRYDLIPVAPLEEVAKVYGSGAAKYSERNWERGYEWSKSYASLQRHLNAFWDGESYDYGTDEEPGTGRHHLANAIFHVMALMEFELTSKGLDDRPCPSSAYLNAEEDYSYVPPAEPGLSLIDTRDLEPEVEDPTSMPLSTDELRRHCGYTIDGNIEGTDAKRNYVRRILEGGFK